ncbi:unnamed protein product [Linum trigynum]|uniref:Uncharacterized protein n=1 Tax=Linum trigynum TaxID=586398 RepID=A0AAV2EVV1_9ROSI
MLQCFTATGEENASEQTGSLHRDLEGPSDSRIDLLLNLHGSAPLIPPAICASIDLFLFSFTCPRNLRGSLLILFSVDLRLLLGFENSASVRLRLQSLYFQLAFQMRQRKRRRLVSMVKQIDFTFGGSGQGGESI